MTDRYVTLTVVLEREIRDDDAKPVLDAIRQIKGVLSVTGEVADPSSYAAYERAKNDMRLAIWEAINATKPR